MCQNLLERITTDICNAQYYVDIESWTKEDRKKTRTKCDIRSLEEWVSLVQHVKLGVLRKFNSPSKYGKNYSTCSIVSCKIDTEYYYTVDKIMIMPIERWDANSIPSHWQDIQILYSFWSPPCRLCSETGSKHSISAPKSKLHLFSGGNAFQLSIKRDSRFVILLSKLPTSNVHITLNILFSYSLLFTLLQ